MSSSSLSSMSFPTETGLATLLAASLLAIGSTVLTMYIILVQIELQRTLSFASEEDEVQLEESTNEDEGVSPNVVKNGDASKPAKQSPSSSNEVDTVSRRLYLPRYRRASLAASVVLITFMAYLLLARSNANVVLNWLGMITVLGLSLRSSIAEELQRDRFERLACIASMVLILAMAMNLAVYANQQHAQGDIYEGEARIISYDSTSYSQDEGKDSTLRMDLRVAWGGSWGCPNLKDQWCEAPVAGTLCETTAKSVQGGNQRRTNFLPQSPRSPRRQQQLSYGHSHHRVLTDEKTEAEQEFEQDLSKTEEYVFDEIEEAQDAAQGNQNEEDDAGKNQDLKDQNQDLKEKNQELQDTHDELEQELEDLENTVVDEEEEEEELDEAIEEAYSFDDDVWYDDYWSQTTWNDVWGDYSCEDLFDYDLSGLGFDNDEPPGTDDWPFVNIYGNCKTCSAYVIDYYSTEHFQSILDYKKAALNYGILAGLSLWVTAYLVYRELNRPNRGAPSAEKEIELLPTINGALA